jgi:hypothetical protein
MERITANPIQEKPQRESMTNKTNEFNEAQFAFSVHPIKNFYARRRKKSTMNEQEKQDSTPLNTGNNNITVKLSKKRKASSLNDNISGQSLRRSSRLSKKNIGYKNRNILESAETKGSKGNKKEK